MAARQVEGLQFERVADEILAVKPATLEAHALNQSAAAVFDLCDGKASKSDMAAAIQRRTGLPADEEIVELALAELVDAGLVGGRSGTAVHHFPAVVGSTTLAVGSSRHDAPGRGDHSRTSGGRAGVSHADLDRNRDPDRDRDADRHRDRDPDRHRDRDPNSHRDRDPNRHCDRDPDPHRHLDPDRHSDLDPDPHRDGDFDENTDSDADSALSARR